MLADESVNARLKAWKDKLNRAADFRNELAHGNDALIAEATADCASEHLQFIGELINRVCGQTTLDPPRSQPSPAQ